MSHTSVLKTIKINNIDALREAVEFLNSEGIPCSLVENQYARMYYDQQGGKCDYVLKLSNCNYDVGFQKQSDGSYAPIFDTHAGYLERVLGTPNCPVPKTAEERNAAAITRLLDCYAVHAAKSELQNSGDYYSYDVAYDKSEGAYTLEATQSY